MATVDGKRGVFSCAALADTLDRITMPSPDPRGRSGVDIFAPARTDWDDLPHGEPRPVDWSVR